MSKQNTVLVGWKKSMTSAANTFMVEIDDDNVWFGRLGSGGAHWDPNWTALNLRGGPNIETRTTRAAGAALGKVIGNKIMAKFAKEVEGNVEKYDAEGRDALTHKANQTWPKSEFKSATLTNKMGWNAPAALKTMPAPYLEAKLDGKTWFFLALPGAPSVEEFLDAVQ